MNPGSEHLPPLIPPGFRGAIFKPALGILPPNQRALWDSLGAARKLGFVLYGGTAISLRLGHRVSVDFDFFSDRPFEHSDLLAALPFRDRAEAIQKDPNSLTLLVDEAKGEGEGVKVSFFGGLTFGRVGEPDLTEDGLVFIASPLDLLGTKLKVIQQRAEKKDYVDIHALIESGMRLEDGLAAGMALYGKSFPPSEALKALTYFGDGNLKGLAGEVKEGLIKASASIRNIPLVPLASANIGFGGA